MPTPKPRLLYMGTWTKNPPDSLNAVVQHSMGLVISRAYRNSDIVHLEFEKHLAGAPVVIVSNYGDVQGGLLVTGASREKITIRVPNEVQSFSVAISGYFPPSRTAPAP